MRQIAVPIALLCFACGSPEHEPSPEVAEPVTLEEVAPRPERCETPITRSSLEEQCSEPDCQCEELGSARTGGATFTAFACVDDRAPHCNHRDCVDRVRFGLVGVSDERGSRHYRSTSATSITSIHAFEGEDAIALLIEDAGDSYRHSEGASGVVIVGLDGPTRDLCELGRRLKSEVPGEADRVGWQHGSELRRQAADGSCTADRLSLRDGSLVVDGEPTECICARPMPEWDPDAACLRDGRSREQMNVRFSSTEDEDLVETVECAHELHDDVPPFRHLRLTASDGNVRWYRAVGPIAGRRRLDVRDVLELSTHRTLHYDRTIDGLCLR